MANIQTPDSIGALPRSRTELIPAAQSVGIYSGATRVDVAEPPQTNGYSQLGAALEKFAAGPGVAASHIAIENKNIDDRAFGSEAAQRLAMDKSVKDVNQAVKDKLLPEGMSPTAMLAFQSNFAKLRAEQEAIALRQEYYNSDLPNNPDPTAFQKWSQERLGQSIKGITQNEDESPRFSNLELSKSGFHHILNNAVRGLETEHIAHRTTANKKMFKENTSTLVSTGLEKILGTGTNLVPFYLRNQEAIAEAIVSPYRDKNSGQVTLGGMDGSEAADDMQDALIQKALVEKDPTILDSARFVKTNGDKTMADSLKWKTKALAAHRDIAGQQEVERHRRQQWLNEEAQGGQEEIAKASGEKFRYDKNEVTEKMALKPRVDALLKARTPEEHDAAVKALSEISEEKAIQYVKMKREAKLNTEEFEATASHPTREIELRNLIGARPGDSKTMRMIDLAAMSQHGQRPEISLQAWQRLRSFGEKFAEDTHAHKDLLESTDFKQMEHDLRTTVKQDPNDTFGVTGIHANDAAIQLKLLAIETRKALGPQASPLQVVVALRKGRDEIASHFNSKVKDALKDSENRKKDIEAYQKYVQSLSTPEVKAQVKAAEDETKLIQLMDKAGKKVTPESLAAEKAQSTGDYDEKTFNTKLSPKNETAFLKWKALMAPKDSGDDYDLRGAFKAGIKPDPKTKHWPDTFKKPNHPTFSDQSRYAKFGKPGRWEGDTFIPAKK